MKIDRLKQQLFEEICNIYSKDIQKFIYSLTRKDQFAMEEVFQNTIVQALQGLPRLKETDKMKTWIYSIAKAETRRYYAKNQNTILLSEDISENRLDNNFSGDLSDFTKAVGDKDLIKSLLNKLPEEEQQIYILHYYYGMSLIEISEILNINYNTIKTIHVRGIRKFKGFLGKEELK